jgi:hypothetical protein
MAHESDNLDNVNELLQEVHDLTNDVFELQSEIEALDYSMREKRKTIEMIVRDSFSGKLTVPGLATINITADTTAQSVDVKKLKSIATNITETANSLYQIGTVDAVKQAHMLSDIANDLAKCITESVRKGSMRITRK